MSRNQASAKRASRAILELAKLLTDGEWYSTSYLGVAAGKYVRPEIAWRSANGSTLQEGQRRYINLKLDQWERLGRVEKRRRDNFTEWRLGKVEWVNDYLAELVKRRADSGQQDSPLEKLDNDHSGTICAVKASGVVEPAHKPGRPRAVPDDLVYLTLNLYQQGYGYRAIARMLRDEGLNPCFGTIRNIIKSREVV